jgi:hypothetical protein
MAKARIHPLPVTHRFAGPQQIDEMYERGVRLAVGGEVLGEPPARARLPRGLRPDELMRGGLQRRFVRECPVGHAQTRAVG